MKPALSSRTVQAFVCGWPIEHSMSPVIHSFWLEQYGIDGSYERQAVPPDAFPKFLDNLRGSGFSGGNITIPHKESALKMVDRPDDAARRIGAVNTLWFEEGALVGGNTDWIGFTANLDDTGIDWHSDDRTALVIGAGGAARAVLYALLQRGFSNILLANRTLEKAENLATEFGPSIHPLPLDDVPDAIPRSDLVINTSSMGMGNASPFPKPILESLSTAKPDSLVTDIVYTPLDTPLLVAAKNAGRKTVDGLGMLLHQATPGFEKWFGVRPEVTGKLRARILQEMGKAT